MASSCSSIRSVKAQGVPVVVEIEGVHLEVIALVVDLASKEQTPRSPLNARTG
jgi:hypothetical protein